MTHQPTRHGGHWSPGQRGRRGFWLLVGVAVLATGALSSALNTAPSPVTGLRVVTSGSVLVVSLALAARVMIALEAARRHSRSTTCPTPRRKPRRQRPAR